MTRKLKNISLDKQLNALRSLQGEITAHVNLEDDAKVDNLSRDFEAATDILLEFQPDDYSSFIKKCNYLELMLTHSHDQPELVKRIFDVIRRDVETLSQS